jgi:signal transduction histidine kinase
MSMRPEPKSRPFYYQVVRLRWMTPVIVMVLVILHQAAIQGMLPWVDPAYHAWLTVALYGFSGSLIAWVVLGWLAENIAEQAQIAAELRQTYEKLTQNHRQLLAAHDIGCEIASANDTQKILEMAVRAPTQLAGAVGSAIVTFDEKQDRLRLDMAWGLNDAYMLNLRQRLDNGIPANRCQNCNPLKARISSDCPLFEGLEDVARVNGIRSIACLPIGRDQKREGIIGAYFPSPDGPPEEQMQLLNIIATEIASALDGTRLRARQMAAVYAIEKLAEAPLNLDSLLQQVLDISLAGWGVTTGALLLYDAADAAWSRRVQRGLGRDPGQLLAQMVIHLAESVRQTGQPILIPSLAHHPGWPDSPSDGPASAAAAPLLTAGQQLGALVMLSDQPDRFQARQAPLLSAIAHQAALAISHAQLQAQVQQLAVLEERYRLSREMHDGLAQTLGALGWQLDHLKMMLEKGDLLTTKQGLEDACQVIRSSYLDVREAIDGLRLAVDHPGGLAAALAEFVADFEERTSLKATFEADLTLPALPPQAELQLLRIVQEGLTNVRKHAAAGQVWVKLQATPTGVVLSIADDGRGFDLALPRGRQKVGLAGMRERVQSLGGTLTLATNPGQGTRLTVALAGQPEGAGSKNE